MIWIILAFGANFISSWIRIRIRNADPDPGDKFNPDTDPDPKHWPYPQSFLFWIDFFPFIGLCKFLLVLQLMRSSDTVVISLLRIVNRYRYRSTFYRYRSQYRCLIFSMRTGTGTALSKSIPFWVLVVFTKLSAVYQFESNIPPLPDILSKYLLLAYFFSHFILSCMHVILHF
jgi:hypothetical protein